MYFLNSESNLIKHIDGDTTYVFSDQCAEGWYEKYLAWLAEGNTPEEWNGE
jgi:hypothetical protein